MTPQSTQRKNSSSKQQAPSRGKAILKDTIPKALLNALRRHLKLSKVEAKAYASLMAMGQLSQYEVARYSRVPLEKTDRLLNSLENKQLIKAIPGVVKRYHAFPPYRDLARIVEDFDTMIDPIWDEFQILQRQTAEEVSTQFQATSMEISNALERWNKRHGATLEEISNSTKNLLDDTVADLKAALASISEPSKSELSKNSMALQQNLQTSIKEGITQVDEIHKQALQKADQIFETQRATIDQWLSSASNQLLDLLESLAGQTKTEFANASMAIQQATEQGIKTSSNVITTRLEEILQQNNETTTTAIKTLKSLGEKIQQNVFDWQAEQRQKTEIGLKTVNEQLQESWGKGLHTLERDISGLVRALRKESQRLTQETKRGTTKLSSTLKRAGRTATQIGDTLTHTLQTALGDSVQGYIKLQKDTEKVIAQWPPPALATPELAKIKEKLAKITQQATQDFESLLSSMNEQLVVEMRDAYLALFSDTRTLLEEFAENLDAQHAIFQTQIQSQASELEKGLKNQTSRINQAAKTCLQDIQTKIKDQEKLGREFSRKAQVLVNRQTSTIIDILDGVEAQLREFDQDHLVQARDHVEELSTRSTAKIKDNQSTFKNQLDDFQSKIQVQNVSTTQSLRGELASLNNTIKQNLETLKTKRDGLYEKLTKQILDQQSDLNTLYENQRPIRDNQINVALKDAFKELRKSQTKFTRSIQRIFRAELGPLLETALSRYQKTFENRQTVNEKQATTEFHNTISTQNQNELLEKLKPTFTDALTQQLKPIYTQHRRLLTKQQRSSDRTVTTTFQNIVKQLEEDQPEFLRILPQTFQNQLENKFESTLTTCITKIKRQTNREPQITKILQETQEQLTQLPSDLIPDLTDSLRAKFIKRIEGVLAKGITKIKRQTNREPQITKILQETQEQLTQLPTKLLSDSIESSFENLLSQIKESLENYRAIIKKHQTQHSKQLNSNLMKSLENIAQYEFFEAFIQPIQEYLTETAGVALGNYHATMTRQKIPSEKEATTAFHSFLNEQIKSASLGDLRQNTRDYQKTLKNTMNKVSSTLTEITDHNDTTILTQFDNQLTLLAQLVEDQATSMEENLTNSYMTMNDALSDTAKTITTTVTNFQEENEQTITTMVDRLDYEKIVLGEEIGQILSQTSEACLTQIDESRTLLDSIRRELVSKQSMLQTNVEVITSDLRTEIAAQIAAIQKSAKSATLALPDQLHTLSDQILGLINEAQFQMHQQEETLADALSGVSDQLKQFAQDRVEQAQETVDDLSASSTTKISEHRSIFLKDIDNFEMQITKESDAHISAIQKELEQLQKTAEILTNQIGETAETLRETLLAQIETAATKYKKEFDEFPTKLEETVSAIFQTILEAFPQIPSDLISKFGENAKSSSLVLEEAMNNALSTLEEILHENKAKAEKNRSEQNILLMETIEAQNTAFTENQSTINAAIESALTQTTNTVTTTLETFREESNRIFTATVQTLDREEDKIKKTYDREIEQTLQTFLQDFKRSTEALHRSSEIIVQHIRDNLQSIQETINRELQRQTNNVVLTINRFVAGADDSVISQSHQTNEKIVNTLEREWRSLKTETQDTIKDTTHKLDNIRSSSLATLRTFKENTQPMFRNIQKGAKGIHTILIEFLNAMTQHPISEAERTWRIVSSENIQYHLEDMLRRADTTITLAYPSINDLPLDQLVNVKPEQRIHLITTFDEDKHHTTIQKILEQDNIRLWQNPKMEFYAGSRDSEEVLIAPLYGEPSEIVAVVSDQESYITLLNQNLGPSWIAASSEIRRKNTS